jgi:hypothetical protein
VKSQTRRPEVNSLVELLSGRADADQIHYRLQEIADAGVPDYEIRHTLRLLQAQMIRDGDGEGEEKVLDAFSMLDGWSSRDFVVTFPESTTNLLQAMIVLEEADTTSSSAYVEFVSAALGPDWSLGTCIVDAEFNMATIEGYPLSLFEVSDASKAQSAIMEAMLSDRRRVVVGLTTGAPRNSPLAEQFTVPYSLRFDLVDVSQARLRRLVSNLTPNLRRSAQLEQDLGILSSAFGELTSSFRRFLEETAETLGALVAKSREDSTYRPRTSLLEFLQTQIKHFSSAGELFNNRFEEVWPALNENLVYFARQEADALETGASHAPASDLILRDIRALANALSISNESRSRWISAFEALEGVGSPEFSTITREAANEFSEAIGRVAGARNDLLQTLARADPHQVEN